MPWQQYVVDVALEVDPGTGRLAYDEVRLTVPRQSGKSTLLLPLIVHRMLAWREPQRVAYTAQTAKDARSKWEDDFLPLLLGSPLAGQVARVRKTNGSEAVRFKSGSLWEIVAPTETGGHGKTLDLPILDEAFALVDNRVEQALKPTMTTRPEPQYWVVSTAGRPETSPYLWGKVEDGRARAAAQVPRGVAYFEWSAPEEALSSDPATWEACMPALGHTTSMGRIRGYWESMDEPEFRRAYLNQWFAPASDTAIPMVSWNACQDVGSRVDGGMVWAVDVSVDRAWSSIAVAGYRADGVSHVELVDRRPGTDWVPRRVAELRGSHGGRLVVDPGGPVGSLTPLLDPSATVSAREHAAACGQLYDAVVTGQVRHLGQPELNAALAGATKRSLGDAWAWARQHSSVDISPLVAVTLARWALVQPEVAAADPVVVW